jgi:hypothetical protein
MMDSSDLGYILDLIAGFWIIQSIILRSKRHIRKETAIFWDGAPFIFEAQLIALWDGWFGVIQLLVGTIFHLYHFELGQKTLIIVVLGIIIVSIIFRLFIKKIILRQVKKDYPDYEEMKKGAK